MAKDFIFILGLLATNPNQHWLIKAKNGDFTGRITDSSHRIKDRADGAEQQTWGRGGTRGALGSLSRLSWNFSLGRPPTAALPVLELEVTRRENVFAEREGEASWPWSPGAHLAYLGDRPGRVRYTWSHPCASAGCPRPTGDEREPLQATGLLGPREWALGKGFL